MFPLPSSKVQVIFVLPPSTKFSTSVVVPVIEPATHASVVVGAVNTPSQSTVTGDNVGVTGAVVSDQKKVVNGKGVYPFG